MLDFLLLYAMQHSTANHPSIHPSVCLCLNTLLVWRFIINLRAVSEEWGIIINEDYTLSVWLQVGQLKEWLCVDDLNYYCVSCVLYDTSIYSEIDSPTTNNDPQATTSSYGVAWLFSVSLPGTQVQNPVNIVMHERLQPRLLIYRLHYSCI